MFSKQIEMNIEVYVDDILVKSKEEFAHLDKCLPFFNSNTHKKDSNTQQVHL